MSTSMSEAATESFEASRPRLRALAYRMLGSPSDADDAVQEAWLRLNRSDAAAIDNLGGWLTTVVARICLDVLRSRRTRGELPAGGANGADPAGHRGHVTDLTTALASGRASLPGGGGAAWDEPDSAAVLADTIGPALMLVLDALAPAERVAFVLHDLFEVPFEEIAPIVDRSPVAARQLASRARRRVRASAETTPRPAGEARRPQRRIVDAFLAASRNGDFTALLAVLDPNVVLRADPVAVGFARRNAARGAPPLEAELRGAETVARAFVGRAAAAELAVIAGLPGAAWAPGGRPRLLFAFATDGDRVVSIELIADAERIAGLEVSLLPPQGRR
jgi:RNA polymerase sigma-70 factor (ECF subfamily)